MGGRAGRVRLFFFVGVFVGFVIVFNGVRIAGMFLNPKIDFA